MNDVSNSYESLDVVKASEVPELVAQCLATGTNLLIYGEPGCGKSSIIQGMAANGDYYLVTLGAASLCEDTLNGIPVYDAKTKTTHYAVPEWLQTIYDNHEENPDKPQILFLDEMTLAMTEVKNGCQLLLTDRCVPTLPNMKLPDNVVIVSATNTAEDSSDGEDLSRPLKTRFMSVRMTNSPDEYKIYVQGIAEERFPHLKEVLGPRFNVFFDDVIDDMKEFWCDNTKFYGTNPRTLMNLFKTCDYIAGKNGMLTFNDANTVAKRTVGHRLTSANWTAGAPAKQTPVKMATDNSLIPTDEALAMMTDGELEYTTRTISQSKIATTKAGIETMMKINVLRERKRLEAERNN